MKKFVEKVQDANYEDVLAMYVAEINGKNRKKHIAAIVERILVDDLENYGYCLDEQGKWYNIAKAKAERG